MPVACTTISLSPASSPSLTPTLRLYGGDFASETISIPNPSTYLPALKGPPHPRPSLASLDAALKSLEALYLLDNHDEGHDLPRRVALTPVEQAWEDELCRVRNDRFETDWVNGWLMRWVAYGSEWLEELGSHEEEEGEEEEKVGVDNDNEEGSVDGDLLDAVEREERRRVEGFIELAATILAVLSGTGGMFFSFSLLFPLLSLTLYIA
jgi:hypothetical protein